MESNLIAVQSELKSKIRILKSKIGVAPTLQCSITPVGPISIVEFYEIDELRFQLRLNNNFGMQCPMNRTAVGNLQQPLFLLIIKFAA